MIYDPDGAEQPFTEDEILAAHHSEQPTPTPAVGDRVLYRHDNHGDVTDALVLEVGPLDDLTDPHLWERDQDGNITGPRPAPWHDLTLRTLHGTFVTREARVRGSAGWLPADWKG